MTLPRPTADPTPLGAAVPVRAGASHEGAVPDHPPHVEEPMSDPHADHTLSALRQEAAREGEAETAALMAQAAAAHGEWTRANDRYSATLAAVAKALGLPRATYLTNGKILGSWDAVAALPGATVGDWWLAPAGDEQRCVRAAVRGVEIVAYETRRPRLSIEEAVEEAGRRG